MTDPDAPDTDEKRAGDGILRVLRIRTAPPQFAEVAPTRAGRWGVRQLYKGRHAVGGGTGGCGWSTKREAMEQNPPYGDPDALHTYEPFPRWGKDEES